MSLTPEQRRLRAKVAALTMHALGRTNTGPARAAWERRFEAQVDPEGVLSPEERARRVRLAQRAYMAKLRLRQMGGER